MIHTNTTNCDVEVDYRIRQVTQKVDLYVAWTFRVIRPHCATLTTNIYGGNSKPSHTAIYYVVYNDI